MIEKVAAECRLKNGLSMGSSNQISKLGKSFHGFTANAVKKSLQRNRSWVDAVISLSTNPPKSVASIHCQNESPCQLSDMSSPSFPVKKETPMNTSDLPQRIELEADSITKNIDVCKNTNKIAKTSFKLPRKRLKRLAMIPLKYRMGEGDASKAFRKHPTFHSNGLGHSDLDTNKMPDPSPITNLKDEDLNDTEKHSLKNDQGPLKKRKETTEKLPIGKSSKKIKLEHQTSKDFVRQSKKVRCKKCKNCRRKNCGECRQCLDMVKFGGQGNLRQCCIKRRCLNKSNNKMTNQPSAKVNKNSKDVTVSLQMEQKLPSIKEGNELKQNANKVQQPEEFKSTLPMKDDNPNLSRRFLMAMALQNSEMKKLSFSQIKEFIIEKFPFYKNVEKDVWQGFRQTLRHSKTFRREPSGNKNQANCFWSIDDNVKLRTSKALKRFQLDRNPKIYSKNDQPNDSGKDEILDSSSLPVQILTKKVIRNTEKTSFPEASVSESTKCREEVDYQKELPEVLQKALFEKTNKDKSLVGPPFMGFVDYQEQYDPDIVQEHGQAVIASQDSTLTCLCFLCGSAGIQELVFCRTCCEPFHPFCKDPHGILSFGDVQCGQCSICYVCNVPSPTNQIICTSCNKAFDKECLSENAKELVDDQLPNWLCSACLRCGSCGAANVTTFDSNETLLSLKALCEVCAVQRKKGSFCPLCRGSYDDNDYDTRMVECCECNGWVHARCNHISEENYQILSYLPDSIEFVCRNCHKNPDFPPEWEKAVESAKKLSRISIVQGLFNHPSSKYFVKSEKPENSLHKISDCDDLSEPSNLELISMTFSDNTENENSLDTSADRTLSQCYTQVDSGKRPLANLGNSNSSEVRHDKSLKSTNSKEALYSGKPILTKAIVVPLKSSLNGLKKKPFHVRDLPFSYFEKNFNLKQCSVVIEQLEEKLASYEKVKIKDCVVSMNDIRKHSWWGPKITKLCGENSFRKTQSNTSQKNQPLSSPYKRESLFWSGCRGSCEPKFNLNGMKDADKSVSSNREFDLNLVLENIHKNIYEHIAHFHSDIKRVIENSNLRGPKRKSIQKSFYDAYENLLDEVCPWFHPNNIHSFLDYKQESQIPILPPNSDHEYSDYSLKRLNKREKAPNTTTLMREELKVIKDCRYCKLCGKRGDALPTRAGRLLHLRLDDWIHVSCALWSSEVYEEVDGSLQNISQALKRGTKLQCTFCGSNGATIGCCSENCKSNYHFECGLADGAAFKEDKTVFCPRHKHQPSNSQATKDFRVQRTVHLESDPKKKAKLMDLRKVRAQIGSMQVEALGEIHSSASDLNNHLVPIGFVCSRYFWSTKNPTRITRYTFQTKLKYPPKSNGEENLTQEKHVLIDHSQMANEEVDKELANFQKFCRKTDLNYCKKMSKYTNILPSVFAKDVWKNLSYEKLHPEWESLEAQKNIEPEEQIKTTFQIETFENGFFSQSESFGGAQQKHEPIRDEDIKSSTSNVTIVKTWFNELKQTKLSEVVIQCDLPYDETNFDLEFEEEMFETLEFNDNLAIMDDLIQTFPIFSEIETEKYLEESCFKLGESLVDFIDAEFETTTVELSISQLDGNADDDSDDNSEDVDRKPQISRSQTPANEDQSPKKDFSIAGILSPTDGNKTSATSTPSSTPKLMTSLERPISVPVTPTKAATQACGSKGDILAARLSQDSSQMLAFANPPQPSVFIQHLQTATQAPSFAQTFEQATGRSLQYLASVNNFADLASFPHLQTSLQMNPQGVIQSLSSPYPGFVSPHIGFVGASNILVNPHLGYLNYPGGGGGQQQAVVYNTPQFSPYGSGSAGFLQPPPPPPTPSRLFANPLLYPQHSLVNPFCAGSSIPSSQFHDRLHSSAAAASGAKKVARVQPQPWIRKVDTPSPSSSVSSSPLTSPVSSRSGKSDPLKALSSMASSPMASSFKSSGLTISHNSNPLSRSTKSPHRSVGIQAKIGAPLKILTPRPWREVEETHDQSKRVPLPLSSETTSLGLSVQSSCASSFSSSRPNSNSSSAERPTMRMIAHSALASPEIQNEESVKILGDGSKLVSKRSNTDSIEITFRRKNDQSLEVEKFLIKEPAQRKNESIDPIAAVKALKAKAKLSKKSRWKNEAPIIVPLDIHGNILHTPDQFLNEQEILSGSKTVPDMSGSKGYKFDNEEEKPEGPYVIYELTSDDGYKSESPDHSTLWTEVFEAIQEARLMHGLDLDVVNPLGKSGAQMMGLAHSAIAFLLEQLPGACTTKKYKFRHFDFRAEEEDVPVIPNETGCARTEAYKGRKPIDMFSWLASRHRTIPKIFLPNMLSMDSKTQLSSSRRATTLELPMAMRFRHLAMSAKEAVDVFKSGIEGRGLYCKREIQMGEMVIEYAGECIRSVLTDKREKYYESRGIGCYMFKIDEDTVVDATMKGNAARFINHSCDPNCYSKIVDVLGKKRIIIFAHRKIDVGEELTYDYKFPFEDVKIPCRCGAKRCRKYMN